MSLAKFQHPAMHLHSSFACHLLSRSSHSIFAQDEHAAADVIMEIACPCQLFLCLEQLLHARLKQRESVRIWKACDKQKKVQVHRLALPAVSVLQ